MSDSQPPQTTRPVLKETIELVGFVPPSGKEQAFLSLLKDYDVGGKDANPAIFRVRQFKDGQLADKVWGKMTEDQIGCELLGMITFWQAHGSGNPGGKMAHTTVSGYTDRIGMTCSTSCQKNNIQMVDRFRAEVGGFETYHKKHHH